MARANVNTRLSLYLDRIKLTIVLLTLLAVAVYYFLPPKNFTVAPWMFTYPAVYSDGEYGGPSEAAWINQASLESMCKFRQSNELQSACGVVFAWGQNPSQGLNLTRYHGMYIKLNYEGPAKQIRIYMRNWDSRYSTLDDNGSAKFASLMINVNELSDTVFVRMDEFQVADWWVDQYKVPRQHNGLDFNNVSALGIDYLSPGDHHLQVDSIRLVGEWIDHENFLLSIVSILLFVFIWESIDRFYRLFRSSHQKDAQLTDLADRYSKLEVQRQKFETLSTTDNLTGCFNRYGILRQVEDIFGEYLAHHSAAIMLIDIDHFKRVNDRRGHDAGDKALREIAQLIDNNTRDADIFGRWGGEEFILLSKNLDLNTALALGEKLRKTVAKHRFFLDSKPLTITVSIGLAIGVKGENFEKVFKRADKALYAAKAAGRNAVFSERDLTAANPSKN